MTYRVREVFATLQGEGFWTGKAAVFVRMAACNMWSGRDEDRGRDAERHENRCALWCDTDFVGGAAMSADQIADAALDLGAVAGRILVLTGGEPLLQVDAALLARLRLLGAHLHVETNGTVPLDGDARAMVDWVTMSPKIAPDRLRLTTCDELKVVFPAYDPLAYVRRVPAQHLYVQPQDGPDREANTRAAIEFVQRHPDWRLSVQAHKIVGIP